MIIDYKAIGTRIQNIRKNKGITQEILAEKLDVSVGYVSQIERGITKTNLEMLASICTELDCELTFIISGVVKTANSYLNDEFVAKFNALSERDKEAVVAIMNFFNNN